jgi:uncharacterized protein (TIGR03435 family)
MPLRSLFWMLLLISAVPTPAEQLNGAQAVAIRVATVKPSATEGQPLLQIRGRRFVTAGTTIVDLMKYAYNIHADQIVDGPAWLGKDRFDVVVDPESETRSSSDNMKLLIQELLAERFHLAVNRETRELPVYALILLASPPKLTPTTSDPNGPPAGGYMPPGTLEVSNASLANFATFLQRYVTDRPVVDQTGITGRYEFVLRWTSDDGVSNSPNSAPGLFTAIQEQLGLKLKPVRAKAEVLVVTHVEQPSDN